MAIRANHVIERVGRALYIRPRQSLIVAAQAIPEHLFRLQLRKSNDRLLIAFALNVRLSRAMTALASRFLRRFLARGDALEMRILIELQPDVRMTGFANIASDVSRAG